MSPAELEARVAALEAEVADLKRMKTAGVEAPPWWVRISGTFANDPAFPEAMRLGKEYRDAAPAISDCGPEADSPEAAPPEGDGESR